MINKLIGLPALASEHGLLIDNMLELLHWFIAILLFGWLTFYVYCLVRFRKSKNPKADYHGVRGHASTHVEVGVVIVEAVLLLGFAFPLWKVRADEYPTDSNVVKVSVVAERFGWTMHYAGADGQIGKTRPELIPGSRFGLGIDPNDPAGADDFVTKELVLPKGRNCIIQVSTKDVIHNLAIVPMRIQHDTIPGTQAHMWFKPTKTGEWTMICAQLCGEGHSGMAGRLKVMKAEEWDKWYQGKADAAKPAPPENQLGGEAETPVEVSAN